MSCRILGRGIEVAVLSYVIRFLKEIGYTQIKSIFKQTKKNKQVKNFYEEQGFSLIENELNEKRYVLKISQWDQNKVKHIKVS